MGRAPPGRLFAHDILTGAVLKEDLVENEQYVLLPRAVWALLDSWYGGGDCAVIRSVIQEGTYNKSLRVEVYLLRVRIQECDKLGVLTVPGSVAFYSKKSTVQDVMHSECARLGLDEKNTRCFTMDGEGDEILDETFLDGPQTLDDAMVAPGQRLCFQAKEEDAKDYGLLPSEQQRHQQPQQPLNGSGKKKGGGFFSRLFGRNRRDSEESATGNEGAEMAVPMSATSATSAAMSRREDDGKAVVMDEKGGLRGMQNLGNTCFMNSTLQCLSAVPAFASFFARTERYVELINVDSALGTKGAMTHATTELLHEIWSGVFSLVSPQGFKKVLAKFAGQFHGYQQHDAQEALMVILNLLHEDLTTYGLPEVKGRLPKSPVADLFGGTFRSVVTCDECHTESTIYEPFMNLSLPVPEKERKKINATFFPLDGPPIHIGVRVNKSGNTQHLFHEALVNVLNKPALLPRLVGVHLSGSSCYNLGPAKILNTLREKDQALIYEVQPAADGWLHAHVFSYCAKHGGMDMEGHQMASERFGSHKRGGGGGGGGHHSSGHSGGSGKNGPRAFGVPLVVSYKASDSGAQVLERVSACLSMALGWESPLVFRSASVVKFGGEWDPLRPLPLKSTVESDTAIGLLWGSDEADAISKRFAMVQQHASCEPTPEDKEITVPLSSCFELAGAPESLSAGDNWVCPTCRTARSCVKTMSVWRAPPVLCVHLKRFKVDFYLREKLHTLVEFPQELDVSKFVANGEGAPLQNYRLVGVANHVGGLSGGHYTADCLNNDKWYHFDDRKCSETSWEKLVTPSAYVLFYASEESRQLDLPSVEEMALDTAAAAEESVPKKVKAEEKKPDEEPNAQLTEDDDDAAAVAAVLVAKQMEEEQAIRDGAEDNLTGSTYVCDFCSAPVGGGWEGLTRHAKEKHGAEF